MATIEPFYNIQQLPVSAYDSNKIYFPLASPKTVNFNLKADGFDVKDIYSVYWHFGDPYAEQDGTNQTIKFNLLPIAHTYSQNGIYDVHCIINASTYSIHLNKKISVSNTPFNFYIDMTVSGSNFYATLHNYDPLAITYYKKVGDNNWYQYSNTITGSSDDLYFGYRSVFSDGTETINYAEPVSTKFRIDLLDVYDPSASATAYTKTGNQTDIVYTAYTTAGVDSYSSVIVSATSGDAFYHLTEAVKIRFVNDRSGTSTDILDPSFTGCYVLYRLLSGGGTRMFKYTDHINIKNSDTLYWQIVYQTLNGDLFTSVKSTQFVIDKGVSSDIVGYNQQVYPIVY